MKRSVSRMAVAMFLLAVGASAFAREETVSVSPHGKKYHRAGCREIKHSKGIKTMTAKETVKRHYEPCKVCKPPKA